MKGDLIYVETIDNALKALESFINPKVKSPRDKLFDKIISAVQVAKRSADPDQLIPLLNALEHLPLNNAGWGLFQPEKTTLGALLEKEKLPYYGKSPNAQKNIEMDLPRPQGTNMGWPMSGTGLAEQLKSVYAQLYKSYRENHLNHYTEEAINNSNAINSKINYVNNNEGTGDENESIRDFNRDTQLLGDLRFKTENQNDMVIKNTIALFCMTACLKKDFPQVSIPEIVDHIQRISAPTSDELIDPSKHISAKLPDSLKAYEKKATSMARMLKKYGGQNLDQTLLEEFTNSVLPTAENQNIDIHPMNAIGTHAWHINEQGDMLFNIDSVLPSITMDGKFYFIGKDGNPVLTDSGELFSSHKADLVERPIMRMTFQLELKTENDSAKIIARDFAVQLHTNELQLDKNITLKTPFEEVSKNEETMKIK